MLLEEIPEAVRRLVVEAIDSVPELEAVLLLRSHADRDWSVEEAGARLYVSVTVAAHVLDVLTQRGFLTRTGERYRYAPTTMELDAAVAMLAATYATKLIAVTRLIHSKPSPSVMQFADAFRLRKET